MPTPFMPARSTIAPENLQALVEAAATPQHALRGGQQQYETPSGWAHLCRSLLPLHVPRVLDPQQGRGALLQAFISAARCGVDIDRRLASVSPSDEEGGLIVANCVDFWRWVDEFCPTMKVPAHVANPPFGLRWKLPAGGDVESTEFTWQRMLQHAGEEGVGFIIAGADRLARLGVTDHPWVYCHQRVPAGMWSGVTLPIGIAHWDASRRHRPPRVDLEYRTADPNEHREALAPLRAHYRMGYGSGYRSGWYGYDVLSQALWRTLSEVAREEQRRVPPWNVWLEGEQLRTYLSLRERHRRRLTDEDLKALLRLDRQHPLTLTVDAASRRLLAELVESGAWSIAPEAATAIREALQQTHLLGAPLMPPTDFALAAYADELDRLHCIPHTTGLPFTPGQDYAVTSNTYRFVQHFTVTRRHWDEARGEEVHVEHRCSLSGMDRYLKVPGDDGRPHYFLERPTEATLPGRAPDPDQLHPESDLWCVFAAPAVPTVAEVHPDHYARTKQNLLAMEPA